MPQDIKTHGHREASLQGRNFQPASPQETAEAIDQAFDYRGDVTLTLKDNQVIEGYLFNRDANQQQVEIFVKGNASPLVLNYFQIAGIAFTGEDTANGKSWEAWMAKKASERTTEAEQARQAAIARGEL
ncbi:MAG: hypothetical protein K1X66_08120 [Verrucomicrobiae bacterium]|nr:hypothetical protein [Verrucomicrobiae bacterium]